MEPGSRPHVVIVGGFLTEPFLYRGLRARLLERGAETVSVAPVHVIDWLAAGVAGMGPLLIRAGLAIRRAQRTAAGQPVLVVGHSGGGILARLAMAPEPFDGRCADVADAVGCLVTLGAPHGLASVPLTWRHPGVTAAAFLDRAAPGAWATPTTGYLTVGSTAVPSRSWRRGPRSLREAPPWLRGLPYRLVVGAVGDAGGDGIVGADLAHLPGARQLTFDDVLHGTVGSPWYGDDAIVDRWWPIAVESWQEALAARGVVAGRTHDLGTHRVGTPDVARSALGQGAGGS